MPEAYGQIHLVNGEYQAYGQNLIIDQGTLNFIGPIENPALNIRAIRPHLTRTVGVQITGTANAPVVQLVSDPPLSDSDALSWLVLGHGLSAATEGDASILVGVASSLFGRGEAAKIQGILASKLGLEEIDVKSGDTLEGTVLSLGKRLSSRLYVYYEQSIATVSNIVRLRYDLTPRWSIETSAGDESAIDVFYNMTFD
jgi:translocation and assembly module TamB